MGCCGDNEHERMKGFCSCLLKLDSLSWVIHHIDTETKSMHQFKESLPMRPLLMQVRVDIRNQITTQLETSFRG